MIFARIAVAGAILCTLWFNASYAWGKATDLPGQVALVTLALTVDLCKCGFLPAASLLWRRDRELPAIVLVVLFVPCLAFSIFAGFSSITTNRATTTVTAQASADARARAQAAYDEASNDIAITKTSPLWDATAGCTTIKKTSQREYCKGLENTRQRKQQAQAELDAAPAVTVDPELAVLAGTTGWSAQKLLLTVALWPALLIELVSSLGLYAVSQPVSSNRPLRRWRWRSKPQPSTLRSGSATPMPNPATEAAPREKAKPGVTWPALSPQTSR